MEMLSWITPVLVPASMFATIDEDPDSKVIARLDEQTQARLRSTQILTTLPQIISELIQNSLDAQARHIDIGINCDEWMCWVRDDGLGISKQDLESFSAEDDSMRYRTSKDHIVRSKNSGSVYGFRGEVLASAAQVSCLEIASRSVKARTTWSIIKKADQLLFKGEATRWRRETPGTVVCVKDVFFNLPVRRASHPSALKTWDLVRQEVEIYALVSPSVSFSLEDLRKSRDTGTSNRTFRVSKTQSTLTTFRNLYGRALTEQVETIDEALGGNLRAQGFISLHGASSRNYQFLYINSHPVTFRDLHKAINVQFSSSNFGKNSLDNLSESGNARAARSSPRKIEKKPVYVLNILAPPGGVDNGFDPEKSIVGLKNKTSMASWLAYLTRVFLAKYGFIDETLDGVHENLGFRKEAALERKSVIIGEDHDTTHGMDPTLPPHRRTRAMDTSLVYSSSIPLSQGSISGLDEFQTLEHEFVQRRTIRASMSDSTVPTWLCDALKANTSYVFSEPAIHVMAPSLSYKPHTTNYSTPDASQHHYRQSTNLPFMMANQNSISSLFAKEDLSLAKVIGQIDSKFIACMIDGSTSGNDAGLRNNRVDSSTSTLVLIDQHAADERVRVESFLKELCMGFLSTYDNHTGSVCNIRVRSLVPPKPILLAAHEFRFLNESLEVQELFWSWGIRFAKCPTLGTRAEHPTNDIDDLGLEQVLVETIPNIISDKVIFMR
ncbi:DNA mismatch repair protein [Leucoagaricus gongylophorus]